MSFRFFSRSNTEISFEYEINSVRLETLLSVKDLGIIFDRQLSFKEHIDFIFSKSMRLLGFLKANSSEFHDPTTLKSLYVSLEYVHLEYCSVIWNPSHIVDIVKIEKIQKNFKRFLGFKL